MRKLLFLFIVIAFAMIAANAEAQQVITTSGGHFENENISLSFTIGEPVIETFTSANVTLTQGFQQPWSFYLQQIINVPMGWSGISGYIDPLNKGIEGIFAPWENDLIILASMTGMYWPATGTNTLGNWDYSTGYQIKALNDFDLKLTGSKVADLSLQLDQGWNLIPVVVPCEVDVEGLFAGLNELIIVKEVAGVHLYWPAFNINTLENLIPGKAYFVALNDAGSIEFPACNKKRYKQQPQPTFVNNTPWNDPMFSASSHCIAFPSKVVLAAELQSGDVIGVFDAFGVCCGMAEIASPAQSIALTAFGNEQMGDGKSGFDYGEQFQFRAFRPSTQDEMILEVDFDPTLPNMANFAPHGLSAAKSLKVQALGVNEFSETSINIYPNPSNGIFNLSMSQWPEKTLIHLLDVRGQCIKIFEFSQKPNGYSQTIDISHLPKGVYLIKAGNNDFWNIKKLVLQ
jgi:hypothetical protein